MDLETRLTNLENLVFSFINSQNRKDLYTGYDIEGNRHSISITDSNVADNASAIEDCNTGLMETYEIAESNTSEIEDCNNALMELYEMIGE